MKFENIRVYNFENALRGMRNPKNSWHLSDSAFGFTHLNNYYIEGLADSIAQQYDDPTNKKQWLLKNGARDVGNGISEFNFIGPKDMKLAKTLISGGSEHRKFLRQIFVTVDITAPLYWWKEADTYKVGTAANSTSTMHKLTSKPITLDCFEIDDFDEDTASSEFVTNTINHLEKLRQKYIETNDKKYWKELVRWLPEGWLQTRTITMNYENLLSMVHQREHHKLTEWSGKCSTPSFIEFARSLPYASEFIFINNSNHN